MGRSKQNKADKNVAFKTQSEDDNQDVNTVEPVETPVENSTDESLETPVEGSTEDHDIREVEPQDDDIVKIKINVNVWDHEGNKHLKGNVVSLQRNQADLLLAENKAVRIDPIPAEK